MVKNKLWRYIEWDNGKQGAELYDQKNDPLEYNNLTFDEKYSDVVSTMKRLLTNKK